MRWKRVSIKHKTVHNISEDAGHDLIKIRWKYVRVIASPATFFWWRWGGWVMGAIKFGMICYNHHLSSGSRHSSDLGHQGLLGGQAREKSATEDKNWRTNNHALRGKMINNGCEEWNINNPEYLQCWFILGPGERKILASELRGAAAWSQLSLGEASCG